VKPLIVERKQFRDHLAQRFYGSRPQMGSQSKMLGSQKFNSDTLHQDLICYTAKNKHIKT